jgi:hypothetical protein
VIVLVAIVQVSTGVGCAVLVVLGVGVVAVFMGLPRGGEENDTGERTNEA